MKTGQRSGHPGRNEDGKTERELAKIEGDMAIFLADKHDWRETKRSANASS